MFYFSIEFASDAEKKRKSSLLVSHQNRYNQKFDAMINYAKDVACVIDKNRQDIDGNFADIASEIIRLSSDMMSHYKNACSQFCSGKYDEGNKERKNGLEKAHNVIELVKDF